MLPRQNKLSRASFPSYKEHHLTWVGSVLRIQSYPPAATEVAHERDHGVIPPLFAVVVAKRFGKSAVLRHAFKRQVLSSIAIALKQFEQLPYGRYVLLPKGELVHLSPLSIAQDIHDFISLRKKQ
jgi:ribonuclease P protein component